MEASSSYKVCGQTLESLADVKCMKLVKNIKLLGKKETLYSLDVFLFVLLFYFWG